MNDKLNILLRKNKGRKILPSYEQLFIDAGLKKENLKHVSLDDFDSILSTATSRNHILVEHELFLKNDFSFLNSKILAKIWDEYRASFCYVFTDNFEYCGAYLIDIKESFKNVLKVAHGDLQGTCFVLDVRYGYYIRINFYSEDHSDDPNTFDVQITWLDVDTAS